MHTNLIHFYYALAGLGLAVGLFLYVRSTLDRASGRPIRTKYWGGFLRLASIVVLGCLILIFKSENLAINLAIFFGIAIFTLIFLNLVKLR
jgi:uncharacterized membrane protein YhaH (DUF805 family)